MAKKDPAFLFYSQDFLTGVQDLTMEERGMFITLLCVHHQKGRMTKKTIDLICHGNATADVMAKLTQDENGLYYNERLELERDKRAEFSTKQKQRALDGWEKRRLNEEENKKPTANATALPLVNENVIINIPTVLDFDSFWDLYDKKVGDKTKLKTKFNTISEKDRQQMLIHIPAYKIAQPDKAFRKDPATYLNNKSWNDEIIVKAKVENKPQQPQYNPYAKDLTKR